MKKGKKQKKALLGALIVLILLLAVNFGLGIYQKQEENESETEQTVEFPVVLTEDNLSEVTVENENGTITFVKNGDSWKYKEDENFPLDQESLETKLNSLVSLSATRKLEEPEELSEYGLDDPKTVVTVKTPEETVYTIKIGNENQSTGDSYVMVNDEQEIYTIPSTMPDQMSLKLYDVAQAEDFPALTSTDVTGIRIMSDEKNVEFTKLETEGVSSWKIKDSEENQKNVDSSQMDSLLSNITALSYNGYVDYKDDHLEKYGLNDPCAQITITTLETEKEEETETEQSSEEETETEEETEPEKVTVIRTLLVGSQDKDGNYYVHLEGQNGVHTMAESTLNVLLELDELDYLDLYVNDIPLTVLNDLKVTYEGKTTELTVESEEVKETESEEESETEEEENKEKETDSEEETESETEGTTIVYHYLVDRKEADETAFQTFYNNLISLKAQRRLSEEEIETEGKAELKLEFTKTDGSVVTVEYYLGTDGLYTVLSNENLPAKVSKLEVESVLSDYKELLEGDQDESETAADMLQESEEGQAAEE